MFKKIACAAALAILANTAFAADGSKFYIGADAGTSKLDDFSGRETSYGVFAGYAFTPQLALEGGYRRFAEFDYLNAKVKLNQASISVIGSMPMGSGFSLFGRLGYNHLEAKASYFGYKGDDSTSSALFGIGAAYEFSPAVAARIELQRPSSDSTNFSAGVVIKF